jgi:glycosyltransferase involved in cell wall biosynthesis
MERKNPIGAVEAFRRAFPADHSSTPPVRLIIKTMNGSRRPDAVARLQAAIGDDPRIELCDEQLDIADLYELIERADALVSLHRSEGLGLHLAEAMWLGTPVIATGYSGNLDLMDETSAGLVRFAPIPVRYGDDAYPASATWADPDLDHAAELMQRLVVDEGWRSDLIATARSKMAAQPPRAEAGASLVRMLDRAEPRARRTRSR